jgi:hypothetical protein
MKDKYSFEQNWLLTCPVGTYILLSWELSQKILIKWSEDEIRHISKYEYAKGNIIDIDAFIKEIVTYQCGDPQFDLKICDSILDISFLTRLDLRTFTRVINSWTPDFLDGVKHLYFNFEKPTEAFQVEHLYVELLIYLAKNNLTDISLHINKSCIVQQVKSNEFCKATLDRMEKELQGDAKVWATDKFLEVIFYNTHADEPKLLLPQENSSLQKLYNDRVMKPNYMIVLAESQREILVHDSILMRFSQMFSKMVEGNWEELKHNYFSFKDYPDAVVEQFLLVAYGFAPELEECDLVELLQFANFVDAPLFINLVNTIFNENVTEWDAESIKMMILSNIWSVLPSKKPFFKAVGLLWVDIIKSVPDKERTEFREKFLNDWSNYLSEKPNKPLEMTKKTIHLTAKF